MWSLGSKGACTQAMLREFGIPGWWLGALIETINTCDKCKGATERMTLQSASLGRQSKKHEKSPAPKGCCGKEAVEHGSVAALTHAPDGPPCVPTGWAPISTPGVGSDGWMQRMLGCPRWKAKAPWREERSEKFVGREGEFHGGTLDPEGLYSDGGESLFP